VIASSGAAIANVELIRGGEADFALVQNAVAYYAFNGLAREESLCTGRRDREVAVASTSASGDF